MVRIGLVIDKKNELIPEETDTVCLSSNVVNRRATKEMVKESSYEGRWEREISTK